MSKFVLCTHITAASLINGVAFEDHPEGKISVEPVGDGDCTRFERIPGYELRDSKDAKPKAKTEHKQAPLPGQPNSVRNAPKPKDAPAKTEAPKQAPKQAPKAETPPPAKTETKDPAAGTNQAPTAPAAGTDGAPAPSEGEQAPADGQTGGEAAAAPAGDETKGE